MDEKVKYIFKKEYVTDHGTLHENSEIRFFRGGVYFDGGLVPGVYAKELIDIVKNDKIREEYLKEIRLTN